MNENQQQGGFGGSKSKQPFGGQKQMFAATCADCHKSCQVPFQPVGDKPVYCKDCFNKRRESTPRDAARAGSPSSTLPKQNFASAKLQAAPAPRLEDLKRQMDAMNTKLDTLLQKFEWAGSKVPKPATKKAAAKKSRRAAKPSRK